MEELRFPVPPQGQEVSALLVRPSGARFLFVLAHGAGAGMRHPFLDNVASDLGDRSIATLRYQFPYMEKGRRPPNPARVLEATARAAVATARSAAPDLRLIAGGKSMGGRITSQAAASGPLPGVEGLVFLGFPLHPPGRPGTARGDHLSRVQLPMLFLQGTRDSFARLELLAPLVERLPAATLHVVKDGDHSFKVLKRSGRNEDDVRGELADAIAGWTGALP
jgi:predicted alpha/beta-hydrolase family hydrolase